MSIDLGVIREALENFGQSIEKEPLHSLGKDKVSGPSFPLLQNLVQHPFSLFGLKTALNIRLIAMEDNVAAPFLKN